MPLVRRRPPKQVSFHAGPFTHVTTAREPFAGDPAELIDASNGYLLNPDVGSGYYARPGFTLLNGGSAVTTSASTFRTQGIFSHTDLDGTTYNFLVMNGKLFRSNATITTFTDVSPVGIGIDTALTTRVYGTTFITQLIVTDGVHRPWLATDLSMTPITGTYIDFDSMGTAWAAFGPFVAYAGSAVCIINSVGGTAARSDIAWSAPADASVGWQQTNYDFRWTLVQSADGSAPPPLYALAADNASLTYWREASIGALSGVPGPNFQGSATHDSISKNVGTLSPQSVVQFGTTKFFVDPIGRPYRLTPGELEPDPLWYNMRAIVSDSPAAAFPGVTKSVCTAAFEPTIGLYIVAPWSFNPAQVAPATEGFIFDGRTGKYFGRFSIADGVQLDCLGVFIDVNGRGVLIVGGSASAPTDQLLATSGFVWGMNSLVATGEFLTTEDPAPGLVLLATEGGVLLTTEGTEDTGWTDNGTVPDIYITTPRFGYDPNTVVNADRVVALVNSGASVQVSAETAAVTETAEGTATASTTQDTVGKLVVGFSGIQGRGVSVTVAPTTASGQFVCMEVSVGATVSNAPPDDV